MRPVAAEQPVSFNAFWLPQPPYTFLQECSAAPEGSGSNVRWSDLAGGHDLMSAAKVSLPPSAVPVLTLHPMV